VLILTANQMPKMQPKLSAAYEQKLQAYNLWNGRV